MEDIKKIFIDTAPFIYFLDGNSKYSYISRDMFLYYDNIGVEMMTSVFTDVEYKVFPKRNNQYLKLQAYDSFKNEFSIMSYSINNAICNIALDIRANFRNIQFVDAFQLAIAMENRCDLFITNDKELVKFNGIRCIMIENYQG